MPSRRRIDGSQPRYLLIRVLSLLRPAGISRFRRIVHAFRRAQVVVPLHLNAGDFLRNVDELIDAHELAAAEVDRLENIGGLKV
jgi:hypothetical protein